MSAGASQRRVGIIGGTGALGRGLAVRLLAAGVEVQIGSREIERSHRAVAELREALGSPEVSVHPGTNLETAEAPMVLLAVPFEALEATLTPLVDALADRIVISAVNPVGFDAVGPHPVRVPAGSAAELVAETVPAARVTAAFHTLSGVALARADTEMDDDVPVVGDDPEAVAAVVDLVGVIPGCRGVAAGPLRGAATLEALVPLLIEVNRRHRRHVGLRFSRL